MKPRYYLAMLSIALLPVLSNVVLFTLTGSRYDFLVSGASDPTAFVGLNLVGAYFLIRPIDRTLRGEEPDGQ